MDLTAGLRAYLFFARRAEPWVKRRLLRQLDDGVISQIEATMRLGEGSAPRPEGTVIWINVALSRPVSPFLTLAERLIAAHGDATVVLTTETGALGGRDLPGDVTHALRPFDTGPGVTRFLDHWTPDVVVLSGNAFWPMALCLSAERGIPAVASEATLHGADMRGLMPRDRAALISSMVAVAPATAPDAAQFRQIGVEQTRIPTVGPLEQGGLPLPCNEAERSTLAELLAVRPVWLAAPVQGAEADAVALAHQRASRLSHRLLLILVPDQIADGPALHDQFTQTGWRTGLRSQGDEPEEDIQVYIADTEGELGLWYRLAPISYMGRSLLPPGGGHNPFEPAALGSAVLFGPHVGRHRSRYDRLVAAGAARQVLTGQELGANVAELLSPERAAIMANAAWSVTSEGAEVTDGTVEMVLGALRRDRV
ncbi:MAG: hypothetical protein KJN93_03905 [Alphaproteobacteria bacterium]|nr:hypothetical protein [Alphaproteobacteria bacterium]NNF23642.1 hypothetical protein [Paracoccaceae bacterium]